MPKSALSFNTRKALSVHLGDEAARKIADTIQRMADRVEQLEQTKVGVMPIVRALPATNSQTRRAA